MHKFYNDNDIVQYSKCFLRVISLTLTQKGNLNILTYGKRSGGLH